MSEEDSNYERRLNALLFEAANKTEEFVRQKIAIIEAGNSLQDNYLSVLQECCRKHDEVLKLEEYVLTRFERALPAVQARPARVEISSSSQDAIQRVAEQFTDPLPFPRKYA